MSRALVVGGGIGGLAAAVALRGAGWDVRLRRPRAEKFVRRSRRIGRMLEAERPTVTAARNVAVRLTPQRAVARATQRMIAWQPPGG